MQFRHALVAAAVVVALLAPIHASAQIESTPIPTAPKPNFTLMSFMVGNWSCSTKSSRRPAPFITAVSYSMDPSGYWINETSTTKATAWVPNPLTINDRITYDNDTKRWIDVTYGDQGAYGLTVSKGWVGNQLTWHDVSFAPSGDIRSQSDTTITKVNSSKVTLKSSFVEAKTGRSVSVTGTCTKE